MTAEIAHAFPRGTVIGIDASPQMISFARKTFPPATVPNLEFQIMDARRIRLAREFDMVFSNAALHWVDDHPAFLRGAARVLRPGGRLVVSCGGKGNAQDVFVALRPEMRLKRWCEFFPQMEKPYFFHCPEDYEKWLPHFGFKSLASAWRPRMRFSTGATVLRLVSHDLAALHPARAGRFARGILAAVTDRYLAKHPPDAGGPRSVRMVRLEIDAIKLL